MRLDMAVLVILIVGLLAIVAAQMYVKTVGPELPEEGEYVQSLDELAERTVGAQVSVPPGPPWFSLERSLSPVECLYVGICSRELGGPCQGDVENPCDLHRVCGGYVRLSLKRESKQ